MDQEDYKQLKAQARELMKEDYQWIMSCKPKAYKWRCPQRWLIEFVHDVSDQAMMQEEEMFESSYDAWYNDLHRPINMQTLYEDFFAQTQTPAPHYPAKALNKLRDMEKRHRIFPDSITLFYMKQIQKIQAAMPDGMESRMGNMEDMKMGNMEDMKMRNTEDMKRSLDCHIIEMLMT